MQFRQVLLMMVLCSSTGGFSQQWEWVRHIGGGTPGENPSLAVDELNNCYVASDSLGRVQVRKYDAQGGMAWRSVIDKANVRGIDYHTSGNLVLTGDTANSVWLVKMDTAGSMLWSKIIGSNSESTDVAFDQQGNIYVTTLDTLLIKLDSSGDRLWAIGNGASASAVEVGDDGYVYVTGHFFLATFQGNDTLFSSGNTDIFLAKYSAQGQCIWIKQAGGNGWASGKLYRDRGNALSVDDGVNIYVTGTYMDTAYFDNKTLISAGGLTDVFVAKYDSSGNTRWVESISGPSDEQGFTITVDGSNNVLVGGAYVAPVAFGGIPLNGWGHYDAFLARYTSEGIFQNVISAGGPSWNDMVWDIASIDPGGVYVAGTFFDSAYFDTYTLRDSTWPGVFIGKASLSTGIKKGLPPNEGPHIFPNPTHGTIFFKNMQGQEIVDIVVWDIIGNKVLNKPSVNENVTELRGLSPGTYLVLLMGQRGKAWIEKVVILPH